MEIPKGITERQLRHWITKGYIFAGNTRPGRGNPYPAEWDQYTRRVILCMARLRELGFESPMASLLAHRLAEQDWDNATWLKVPVDICSDVSIKLSSIYRYGGSDGAGDSSAAHP